LLIRMRHQPRESLPIVPPFHSRPWAEIESFYADLIDRYAGFVAPMLAIVRSVISYHGADTLAGYTSMHTLIVTSCPVQEWPDVLRVDVMARDSMVQVSHEKVVRVRRPGLPDGWALQHGDSISRPADEAVPLFWRFCIEKFGIHPARDHA